MMQEQVTMRDMMVHVSVSTLIYISSLKNYFFFLLFLCTWCVLTSVQCSQRLEGGAGSSEAEVIGDVTV